MNDYPFPENNTERNEMPPLPDLQRERSQISSIALAITFITLTTMLLQLVLGLLFAFFAPPVVNRPWFTMLLSTLPMYLIAMPLSLLLYRLGKPSPPPKRRIGFPAWLALLTVTFAVTYIGNYIGIAVNAIISMITGEPVENPLQNLTAQAPFWANLLFVGILAPILEEIFYRKLVIDRLRRYGDLVAILVSGTLFGLLHGNFSQFFYACMVGFLFGYVYLYSGKLRYTVALHMAVNLVGGVFTSELLKWIDLEALESGSMDAILQNLLPLSLYGGYLVFVLACMILGPISVFLLRKHIRFQKGEVKLNSKSFCHVVLANPSVWILFALILISFLLNLIP